VENNFALSLSSKRKTKIQKPRKAIITKAITHCKKATHEHSSVTRERKRRTTSHVLTTFFFSLLKLTKNPKNHKFLHQ